MKTRHLTTLAVITLFAASHLSAASPRSTIWKESYQLEAVGNFSAAAAVINQVSDDATSNELKNIRLGWLHYQQGNYNDAIQYYQSALKLNPDSIDTKLGITLPLMAQQRWKETAGYAQSIIDQDPWNYLAHVRLLLCQATLKQWKEVQAGAQELAKRYPSQIDAWVYLARAEYWLGDGKKARAYYQHVLILSPDNVEALQYLNSVH